MSPTQQVEPADSITSQDPHNADPKKTKSRRPANTAFRQQRLKAWQPILTPKTVLPLFFIFGIIFAPIGALLLYASSQVQELSIDYTDCAREAPQSEANDNPNATSTRREMRSGLVSSSFQMTTPPKWGRSIDSATYPGGVTVNTNVCTLEFTIPKPIDSPVFLYYRLTNFYQNHRRYVRSLDTEQLKGNARSASQIRSGDCDPLDVAPDGRPYYPCGLIANSQFNDTYDTLLFRSEGDSPVPYEMTEKGIAWSTEGDLYGRTKYRFNEVVPPPNWAGRYPNRSYTEETLPDLHTDEAFQVWMRTAGLPTFSKLAKRNDNTSMAAGTYTLKIWDRFPVHEYGGTKSILISNGTVMGGKNDFLGIAYVVVGGLCILLGAVFTATHLIKPRKLGDHTYLSWNNEQPSTATATGRSVRPNDNA